MPTGKFQQTIEPANEAHRKRTYAEDVSVVLSTLDCVLNGESAAYASSELTTGKRLYALMREHGLSDAKRLIDQIGQEEYRRLVWEPNVAAAKSFARRLRRELGPAGQVITPAPLIAPGWSQPEYLQLWETVIRTRVSEVHFNDGWEHSSGCAFEFMVAQDVGVPTFTERGLLGLREGIKLLQQAVEELEASGLQVNSLATTVDRLQSLLNARSSAESRSPE